VSESKPGGRRHHRLDSFVQWAAHDLHASECFDLGQSDPVSLHPKGPVTTLVPPSGRCAGGADPRSSLSSSRGAGAVAAELIALAKAHRVTVVRLCRFGVTSPLSFDLLPI